MVTNGSITVDYKVASMFGGAHGHDRDKFTAVILLITEETERTANFYRQVLGLPLEGQQHDDSHQHYACRLGSVYFTIQCMADFSGKEPGFGGVGSGKANDSCPRHGRERERQSCEKPP